MYATMIRHRLNSFRIRLLCIAGIVSPSEGKTRTSKKFEIITRSPFRIWYLTKFAGYEITYLTWKPKLFGGFVIRKRLVRVGDFPLARKPSSVAPRAKKSRSKSLSGIKTYGRRML